MNQVLEYLKLNDVSDIFEKIFHSYGVKLIISGLLIFLSFGFDPNHQKALLAVFILIWADCITAIYGSFRSGVAIRSSKFFRTPIKIGIYFGLIYVTHVTGYTIPFLSNILDETIIGFVATTELISIMENIHKMGYPVPSQLVKKLINIRDSK